MKLIHFERWGVQYQWGDRRRNLYRVTISAFGFTKILTVHGSWIKSV